MPISDLWEEVLSTMRDRRMSLHTERSYLAAVDPRRGVQRRHHVSGDTLQRAIKKAVTEAGLNKHGSCISMVAATCYVTVL